MVSPTMRNGGRLVPDIPLTSAADTGVEMRIRGVLVTRTQQLVLGFIVVAWLALA